MIDETTYVAGTRFGLGLAPGEAERIGGAPGDWLMRQIRSPQVAGPGFAALPSSAQNMAYFQEHRRELKDAANDKADAKKDLREDLKAMFVAELRAKLALAMATRTPFYERLVDFWSNHFAVSIKKPAVVPVAGAFEREAIRPHVTGSFIDMLASSSHHPAMLVYLDNAQSIGPGSVAGERRGKGLNENLAREIMELHTLGVNGGYTQTDVTNFAKVITGWGIGGPESPSPGAFFFARRRHEPGTQTIMGRDYPDDGEEQGMEVLRALAASPATAKHIATKLARHFVADDPPDGAVEAIARVFLQTGGDLAQVYAAIVALPAAWDARANPKVKSGYDLVISAARAGGGGGDDYTDYAMKSLKFLGAVPFTADSPAGEPDTARDLAGPDAMVRRIEWARMAAVKFAPSGTPRDLAARTLGPVLSDATLRAMSGARHDQEAFAIVFGSPEFQRR